jgi:hypothetical protein
MVVRGSFEGDEFNIKEESCVGRNQAVASPLLAVRIVWRTGQDCLLANTHLGYSLVPSFNHLANPQHELEWLTPLDRGVEHFAIGKCARIVDSNSAPLGWFSSIAFLSCFDFKLRHTIFKYYTVS